MNQRERMTEPQSGRMQWGSYGFLAGIFIGVVLGWMFAGFIGAFIRVAMVAMVAVPIVLLYIAWRKLIAPLMRPPVERRFAAPANAIETNAVVHGAVGEPQSR